MHTTNRTILSRAIGLGLATFTTASAIVLGPTASATLNSFYCLSIYGVIQIAVLSYSPAPHAYRRVAPSPARMEAAPRPAVRSGASTTRPATRRSSAPVEALAATH